MDINVQNTIIGGVITIITGTLTFLLGTRKRRAEINIEELRGYGKGVELYQSMLDDLGERIKSETKRCEEVINTQRKQLEDTQKSLNSLKHDYDVLEGLFKKVACYDFDCPVRKSFNNLKSDINGTSTETQETKEECINNSI